ncbi:MAG: DNA polymerase III subunit epsilon [Pseudomonadales bacterium]|nr:DNA polymerase III subunit epsilon [Pseudomonadales bacterium]
MQKRQVVLDTETTGINPLDGHKLVEIGAIEIVNRRFTGRTYHQYINPERVVEDEVVAVHGLTNEFLQDKPVFADIAAEFCQFIEGAELIIHNAPFDLGFLNHELQLMHSTFGKVEDHCQIFDSLVMAKQKHPGQRNNLDALCKRYGIDNSHRVLHGALLDSEILADVYLLMTGGQKGLALEPEVGFESAESGENGHAVDLKALDLPIIQPNQDELAQHQDFISLLNKKSDNKALFS